MSGSSRCFITDNNVIEQIKSLNKQHSDTATYGLLYGLSSKDSLDVTAAIYIPEELKTGTFLDHFVKNRCMYPIGVDPVGVFLCNCDVKEVTNTIPMSSSPRLPDELVCLHLTSQSDTVHMYLYNRVTKELQKLEYETNSDMSYKNHILMRLQTSLELTYKFSTKKAEVQHNCTTACQSLVKSLTSSAVFYELLDTDIIMSCEEVIGAERKDTVGKVMNDLKKKNSDGQRKNKKSDDDLMDRIIYVEMLRKLTQSPKESTPFAPVIQYDKVDDMMVEVVLPIDFLLLINSEETLDCVSQYLYRALVRNIHAAQELLVSAEGTEIPTLEVSHFWFNGYEFPVTMVMNSAKTDSELVEWRHMMHDKLMLSKDRPQLRRANRFCFPNDSESKSHLVNPHHSLTSPKLSKGGEVYTVYGRYTYHHYMQDNFDDDKWGCAYRSLQTLISWFNHQGYSSINIPTHREIQQTLVDIGDKAPSFIGSREWIGSNEVAFVLDKLLNVTCKIMFVSSGAEMSTKGRELMHHYRTQGTPIMIGGGEYAHTILGVCYNTDTGDIRYLILDPHYTGTDDLKTVINKGWCGWKDSSFWRSDVFYNMCMPQRPSAI